jgi:hypothetical protein
VGQHVQGLEVGQFFEQTTLLITAPHTGTGAPSERATIELTAKIVVIHLDGQAPYKEAARGDQS